MAQFVVGFIIGLTVGFTAMELLIVIVEDKIEKKGRGYEKNH